MKVKLRNFLFDAFIDIILLAFLILALLTTNWVIFQNDNSVFKLGLFTLLYDLDVSKGEYVYNSVSITQSCDNPSDASHVVLTQVWNFAGSFCSNIMVIRILLYIGIALVGLSALVNTYIYFNLKNVKFLYFNYGIMTLGAVTIALMIVCVVKSVTIENFMCQGGFNNNEYTNCNLGFSFVCPIIVLICAFGSFVSRILSIRKFLKTLRHSESSMGRSLTYSDSIASYTLTAL